MNAPTVNAAASTSEAVLHGRASGVDVALAITGVLGVFRRSSGLRPISVAPLRMRVGPSGELRATSAMVERVAEATGGKTADARLCELDRLTDAGTTAILVGSARGGRRRDEPRAHRARRAGRVGVAGFVTTVGRSA